MGLREDNEQLRQLAQAVMRGQCAREDYRAQRRRMVDTWAGEAPADPPPAIEQTAPNLPVVESATATTPPTGLRREDPPVDAPTAHRGDLWIGLVVVVVVVLAIAGALAYFW